MGKCHPALVTLYGAITLFMAACAGSKKQTAFGDFQYNQFKDSLLQTETNRQADTTNIFDSKSFIPDVHSLDTLLVRIDTFWQQEEAHLMAHLDSLKKGLAKDPGFSAADKAIISENIKAVDSFLMTKDSARTSACTIGDCILYVVIDKSKQVLYLYILGELKDSFLVSTGSGKKYETPEMELHPQGPVLTRYTSRKFPGGNYQGMGNMPYAVFLKNGYAIHGTTPGNYSKLGTRASHGCIRLHPDNAKLFNTLVKTVGLEQTWVSVRDSLR